MYKQECFW